MCLTYMETGEQILLIFTLFNKLFTVLVPALTHSERFIRFLLYFRDLVKHCPKCYWKEVRKDRKIIFLGCFRELKFWF